ncbi:hypothetical protein ACFPN0_30865 [Kitasatospora cinereorecta]
MTSTSVNWLLLGGLFTQALRTTAHSAPTSALVGPACAEGSWSGAWHTPHFSLLTALGILMFARIVRAGRAERSPPVRLTCARIRDSTTAPRRARTSGRLPRPDRDRLTEAPARLHLSPAPTPPCAQGEPHEQGASWIPSPRPPPRSSCPCWRTVPWR